MYFEKDQWERFPKIWPLKCALNKNCIIASAKHQLVRTLRAAFLANREKEVDEITRDDKSSLKLKVGHVE